MTFRVAFVCSGNICRSPTAEAVLRHLVAERGLSDQISVQSYGVGPWHVGQPIDPRARQALRARGLDLPQHIARMIDADDIAALDLIVAIDRSHEQDLQRLAYTVQDAAKVRLLRSYDPEVGPDPDIPDPYYGGSDGFERVLDMVEAGCRGLLDEVAGELQRSP
jgi:protein-tyrosine phosphatase